MDSSSALPFRTTERLTPRTNPNYDIYFSDEKIKTVVQRCLPHVGKDKMNIEHLPSGKSFNNRIYFINLSEPVLNTRPEWTNSGVEVTKSTTQIQSSFLVLKIAGHPFGKNKVQNEVACLLLFEKYCPSVPCPKLIAWSDDGKKIRTPEYPRGFRDTEVKNVPVLAIQAEDGVPVEDVRKETEGQGWMLVTREPGRPVTEEDLSGKAGDQLMRQIGGYVATWRKNLPPAPAAGNLRIVTSNARPAPSGMLYDKAILPGHEVHIEGLIINSTPPAPLTTVENYVAFALKGEIKRLAEERMFGPLTDEMYDITKTFLDDVLRKLPMFQTELEPMKFTHTDISTRNILAVPGNGGPDSGVKVSAIIDFEFAGFFPAYEEFANCLQNKDLEWPLKKYGHFLTELAHLDVLPEALAANIPPVSALGNAGDAAFEFGDAHFHQATVLLRLCINLAPWWIKAETGLTTQQLRAEYEATKARVVGAITFLESTVPEPEERGARGRSRTSSSTKKK